MKIIKCHIENFGQLCNLDMSFSDGLNIIEKENGWGKSTFAAFIKVMFFGFAFDRSRDILKNERKHFKPWQGGVYGGSILFETKEKKYELTRTFGDRMSDDKFELRDALSGKISSDYSENIGEELFDTDRESFEQTFYISQGSCGAYITDKMSANMTEAAASFDGRNDGAGAAEKLAKAANSMTPDRKTGSLYKSSKKISELKNIAAKKPALVDEAARLQENMSELRDSLEKNKKEITDIQAEQAKASEYLEYANNSGRYGMLKENCEQRYEKMKRLRRMFPSGLPDQATVLDDIRRLEDAEAAEKEITLSNLTEEEEIEMHNLDLYLQNQENVPEYDDSHMLVWGALSILFLLIFIVLVFCKMAIAAILSAAALAFCALLMAKNYRKQKHASSDIPEELKMCTARYEDLKARKEYAYKLRLDSESAIDVVRSHLEEWNIRSDGDLFEQLRGLNEALEDYRSSVKEYKNAEKKLESFRSSPEGMMLEAEDETSVREKMKNIKGDAFKLIEKQKISEKTEKLYREAAARYDAARKKLDDILEAEAELESLSEEHDKQLEKYNIILKAQTILEEARTSFNMKYSESLQSAFLRYLNYFADEDSSVKANIGEDSDNARNQNALDSQDFAIDSDGNITYIQDGHRRELDFHSSGYRDIASICLRMAVVDTIYSSEKPCIIFDDPFANLDSQKRSAAEKMMENIGRKHQIIYFTRI